MSAAPTDAERAAWARLHRIQAHLAAAAERVAAARHAEEHWDSGMRDQNLREAAKHERAAMREVMQ